MNKSLEHVKGNLEKIERRFKMNNRIMMFLCVLVFFIGTAFLYYFSNEEIRASILFFGSMILICLVAGLIIASGIHYFLSTKS